MKSNSDVKYSVYKKDNLEYVKNIEGELKAEVLNHCYRMSNIVHMWGKYLKLTNNEINMLNKIAMYHDIGKFEIPKYILLKKGKLTNEEYKIVKNHSYIGYSIINDIPDLKKCAKAILYHHERWDGKGYPEGIKDYEIPYKSRMISIVDAYDAMTSDRVYREGISHKEAITEIESKLGTQFDPCLGKKFIECFDKCLK